MPSNPLTTAKDAYLELATHREGLSPQQQDAEDLLDALDDLWWQMTEEEQQEVDPVRKASRMNQLVSIDPGLRTSGWALFQEIGGVFQFVSAGLSRSKAKDIDGICRDHDAAIPKICGIGRVVVEQMQVYDIQHSKGDPEDLIRVTILGGYLAGRRGAHSISFVEPKTWKGQRPKETIEPLVKKNLDTGELFRVDAALKAIRAKSLLHNAWEAIGIGLWALGRWPR